MRLTEDSLVKRPAIALFEQLGWAPLDCFDEQFGPDGTLGRENAGEVVLVRRLRRGVGEAEPGEFGSFGDTELVQKVVQTVVLREIAPTYAARLALFSPGELSGDTIHGRRFPAGDCFFVRGIRIVSPEVRKSRYSEKLLDGSDTDRYHGQRCDLRLRSRGILLNRISVLHPSGGDDRDCFASLAMTKKGDSQ
jgi:hypothetical protein